MAANIDILYEDNHLIVINKPAGLPSQSDLTEDACAIDLTKDYIKHKYNKPGNVYTSLVHRIDRPVSGVLMLCKTSKGMTRMTEQFKSRRIKKSYLVIVDRPFEEDKLHLKNYLLKDRRKNVSKVVTQYNDKAKHAEMHVEKLHSFGGFTLLKAMPVTGRSHQIRIQLAHIGFPIVGDVKYGGRRHTERRAICLHSHKLTFHHPISKEEITVQALPYQHHWLDYGQLLARVH